MQTSQPAARGAAANKSPLQATQHTIVQAAANEALHGNAHLQCANAVERSAPPTHSGAGGGHRNRLLAFSRKLFFPTVSGL